MKLTINLTTDEAEAFKNWSETSMPTDMDLNDFAKVIFMNGIDFLKIQLRSVLEQVLSDEEARSQLKEDGINLQALEKNLKDNPI
jgi:hypothetical protein